MPHAHRQTSHDGDHRDLLLFWISQNQLLVHPPRISIMNDVHPTGLAQHLAQSRWALPADVTLAIVLLPAFVARGRQPHELADLTPAMKPPGVSDLGPVDDGRQQANASLLGP